MLQGMVDNNQIIDDFATTRMTKAIFAGAAVTGGDLQILWNSVSLLGTTKTAFAGYLSLNDDNGTTFTPKIILDPLNGITSVPQVGTGQSFACWDATGKLVRSDTACR